MKEPPCSDPDRCGRDRSLLCSLVQHLRDRVAHLEQQASLDGLTGIGNRRFYDDALGAALAYASRHCTPLVLALADIDYFKAFNDRHGHTAGDEALVQVAHALAAGRRRSDRLARIGGEEFGLVLPGMASVAAARFVDRLREAVSELPCGVTISVGVATWLPGMAAMDLHRAADEALYAAKHSGRDRVVSIVA